MSARIVLHIDDDEDDRIFVKEAVLGFDESIIFIEASNGKEGLEKLKEFKSNQDLPCLILLDINMPLIPASEVLKQVKEDPQLSEIPLILFTTSSAARDKELAARNQVEFITKPTSYPELVECIQRALNHCPG